MVDIFGGTAFDAYQGAAGAASKMFLATTPGGASYGRRVGDDDQIGDVPDTGGQPVNLNDGRFLSRAGDIRLDHPVRDIQGCDFVSATRLVCASNDPGADLFPIARSPDSSSRSTSRRRSRVWQPPVM